jgi:probable rRNA maturation factor
MQSDRYLQKIMQKARKIPSLSRKGPKGPWKVSFRLVSSSKMIQLNTRYRKKKKVTDILSFPAPKIFRNHGILGELVICQPVAKRQARDFKHSLKDELKVLIVHGLLHLLGFDHEKSKAQAKLMANWEKRLLGRNSGLIVRTHSGNR